MVLGRGGSLYGVSLYKRGNQCMDMRGVTVSSPSPLCNRGSLYGAPCMASNYVVRVPVWSPCTVGVTVWSPFHGAPLYEDPLCMVSHCMGHLPPPPPHQVNRQTPVKTLPSASFGMRSIRILEQETYPATLLLFSMVT